MRVYPHAWSLHDGWMSALPLHHKLNECQSPKPRPPPQVKQRPRKYHTSGTGIVRGQNQPRISDWWQRNPPHHLALSTPSKEFSLAQLLISTTCSMPYLHFHFFFPVVMIVRLVKCCYHDWKFSFPIDVRLICLRTILVVSKIIRSPRSSSAANFLCKETSWRSDYFARRK